LKALLQRVLKASVSVEGQTIGSIGKGLVVLVGVANGDMERDVQFLADKITNLRIFSDTEGKFNLSSIDVKGEILAISQFTLLGDARKGRRPSFIAAAPPEVAEQMFNLLVSHLQSTGLTVNTGKFRSHMVVEIINDGPVTIMLDSALK
jgi:D-tyrosyl-tRNA(Tyr) deacylase